MEHPTSKTHHRMSLYARAAQFSPFAALTGHDAAIKETARITEDKIDLSEDEISKLNARLNYISENLDIEFPVSITYFVSDERKAGGAYVTVSSNVLSIDEYEMTVILTDKKKIPIKDILLIESERFPGDFEDWE